MLKFCNRFLYIVLESLSNETIKNFVAISLSGCFPLGGIFRAQRNFSLFVSSQAELIEKKTKKNCAASGKFRLMENSLQGLNIEICEKTPET